MVFVAIFFFGGGYFAAQKEQGMSLGDIRVNISRELPGNHETLDFDLFWKVWDKISENYYDKGKVVEAEMVYGAIKGMVAAVGDPYTVFLAPTENKVIQEDLKGTFSGVGIQIGFKGTRLAVIAPLPGSPAEKAGVKPGDLIVGIKDEAKKVDRATDGMTLPEAVEIIRGNPNTKVSIAFIREGSDEPLLLDLTRENIDVPSVVTTFVGENKEIAHLKVLKFSAETTDEWKKAVSTLTGPNIKGIVLDVRNNPGGYLQGAIDLASEFLKTGSVVVIEEAKGGVRHEFKVERLGVLQDKKVVVLVNGGSASASEILAGALRDVEGTKLVGEKSFGKGTIQEPVQVEGAGLHITIAKWLTPKGTWVHENGLEPDVKVENKDDTDNDEQLDEAVKLLGQ